MNIAVSLSAMEKRMIVEKNANAAIVVYFIKLLILSFFSHCKDKDVFYDHPNFSPSFCIRYSDRVGE